MIHDAFVEVTCDGNKCSSTENIQLEFVYSDYGGKDGHYNHSDSKVEDMLTEDFEWIITDGKHYCCDDCAKQLV